MSLPAHSTLPTSLHQIPRLSHRFCPKNISSFRSRASSLSQCSCSVPIAPTFSRSHDFCSCQCHRSVPAPPTFSAFYSYSDCNSSPGRFLFRRPHVLTPSSCAPSVSKCLHFTSSPSHFYPVVFAFSDRPAAPRPLRILLSLKKRVLHIKKESEK